MTPGGELRAGIDIGGTKCLGVVVDAAGAVVRLARRPTPHGQDALVATLVELARDLGPYGTLGVGAPGLVTVDGVLRAAPNLVDVTELPLRALLEAGLHHPVAIDNDNTCAAVAEWTLGAARGEREVLFVGLGTGIGGGLVLGGAVQRGHNGFAGELGHMVVVPDGVACVCGRHGCWERYASGSALRRLAAEHGMGVARGEDVVAAARRGDDRVAVHVVEVFAGWVALGVVNLVNALDPAVVVLGGGLVEAGAVLLDPIRRHVAARLYAPEHRPHPRVVPAGLGERAAAIGAAYHGFAASRW